MTDAKYSYFINIRNNLISDAITEYHYGTEKIIFWSAKFIWLCLEWHVLQFFYTTKDCILDDSWCNKASFSEKTQDLF